MAAPPWNTRPDHYIQKARARAIAALHARHSEGLTTLERAYYEALSSGRIAPDKEGPTK
jgi:hypothetical protein